MNRFELPESIDRINGFNEIEALCRNNHPMDVLRGLQELCNPTYLEYLHFHYRGEAERGASIEENALRRLAFRSVYKVVGCLGFIGWFSGLLVKSLVLKFVDIDLNVFYATSIGGILGVFIGVPTYALVSRFFGFEKGSYASYDEAVRLSDYMALKRGEGNFDKDINLSPSVSDLKKGLQFVSRNQSLKDACSKLETEMKKDKK